MRARCVCVCVGVLCGWLCACWCAWCGTLETSVCRFKTPPCVPAKRACHIRHGRFDDTHGYVLNLHKEAFLNRHTHTRTNTPTHTHTRTRHKQHTTPTSFFLCSSLFPSLFSFTTLFFFSLAFSTFLTAFFSLLSDNVHSFSRLSVCGKV